VTLSTNSEATFYFPVGPVSREGVYLQPPTSLRHSGTITSDATQHAKGISSRQSADRVEHPLGNKYMAGVISSPSQ